MAEVILRQIAAEHRLGDRLVVDSAGTGDWHVGEPADSRTLSALRAAGYDGSAHRAKQFSAAQFATSDLIVYFDHSHERALNLIAPNSDAQLKLQPLVSFDPTHSNLGEVPDPYYAQEGMFSAVCEMIERCCRGLFRQVAPALQAA